MKVCILNVVQGRSKTGKDWKYLKFLDPTTQRVKNVFIPLSASLEIPSPDRIEEILTQLPMVDIEFDQDGKIVTMNA